MIAAVTDRMVARHNRETWRALIDQKCCDFLLWAAAGLFNTARGKQDDEIRDICMADKVFGAVDDEVITFALGFARHCPHIRASTWLGHCQAIDLLTTHRRHQVALTLLADTRLQNIGGPGDQVIECH